VTTVEGRSTPFVSLLTPENTGKTNKNNKDAIGQAYTYLSKAGQDFHIRVLAVTDLDPKTITKVQLYNVVEKELVGDTFTLLNSGYYVYDKKISFDLGEAINIQEIQLNVYTKAVGTKIPAISGLLVNNRTSFISVMTSDELVSPATGVSSNVGFAAAIAWADASNNYFLSLAVNHDLGQTVTSIQLNGPAPSNSRGSLIATIPIMTTNAGKIFNVAVNSSVMNWLNHHLGYILVSTTKNPTGALRGQLIPTTTPRVKSPTFSNGLVLNIGNTQLTQLPDGSTIEGNVGRNLIQGGARNLTSDADDDRVAIFAYNSTTDSFSNYFRFELPVTVKNKYVLRGAAFIISAAADLNDTNKFSIGLYNFANDAADTFFSVPGLGKRDFSFHRMNIDGPTFPTYLGRGGLYISVNGSSLVGRGLYVDQFYVIYYVSSAYANNIVKSIFTKGSGDN